MKARRWLGAALVAASGLAVMGGAFAQAQNAQSSPPGQTTGKKPNILVIFGDDVGQGNISAYTRGVVGYRTPNIDRIATEGAISVSYTHLTLPTIYSV